MSIYQRLAMFSAISSLTLAIIWLFLPYGKGQCYDDEVYHAAGDKWIRNGNFLVICDVDKIKVSCCIDNEFAHSLVFFHNHTVNS